MKALLLLLALCAAPVAWAQDAASVNWTLIEADGVNVSSTEGSATGAPVRGENIVVRDYNGTTQSEGEGPLGRFQRWWLGGEAWPDESAPNPDRYVEFAVAPAAGVTFDVDSLSLVINASGTSAMRASLAYDTDPAFSDPTVLEAEYSVPREDYAVLRYGIDAALAQGDSLYFRIYPWVRSSSTGPGRGLHLQDVTISGTTVGEAIEVEGVYWALSADPEVTATGERLSGGPATGTGIEVRSYSGTLADGSGGPLGPFQRWWLGAGVNWPDETAPNPDRYVEFTAAAEAGYRMALDSISVYVNGGGTGEMMASLYWDTDPAFASPNVLAEGVLASRDTLGYFSFPLDRTLEEGETLHVRVYPYLPGGSTSDGKYLFLQAATVGAVAEVAPVPVEIEAEGVVWALLEDTLVTSADEHLVGFDATAGGLAVRDYTGTLADGSAGPYGPFQRWWTAENWPDETAPNAERYVQFAAAAAAGYAMAVDSFAVYLNAGGTGEMMASVFYSTSADFANPTPIAFDIPVSRDALGYYSYPLDLELAEGEAIYVRVYPWIAGGSTSPGKYLFTQAAVLGARAEVPPPMDVRGVFWALTASDTTSVTATGEHLGGAPVQASGLVVRNYASDSDPGPGPLGAIQRWWIGADQDWPDETAPNPDRYIEFAAAAEDGLAFAADSVSLYLNAHGTSNMMATLVYSTDPTFATADTLEANRIIPRTALTLHEYDVNVTVPPGDSLYFRIYPWLDGGGSPTKYVMIQAVLIAGEAVPPVSVDGGAALPLRTALHPAFPNPVGTSATVRYELAQPAEVAVHVYNVLGQRVATLVQERREAGAHEASLDARALASGVYFVRLRAGGVHQTQKLVVTR